VNAETSGSTNAAPLFDTLARTDRDAKRHAESSFIYMNRSADPQVINIRKTLDDWYAEYPAGAKKHLVGRFRSDDDLHHLGALTELAVYHLIVKSGATINLEPADAGCAPYTPDFQVTEAAAPAYFVETTATDDTSFAARKDDAWKNVVYDAINDLECPDFFLGMEVSDSTKAQPSSKAIKKFLIEKIKSVTYDGLMRQAEMSGMDSMPRWEYAEQDWSITFFPIPKKPQFRSTPGVRPIGMMMDEVYTVNSHVSLREELDGKAKKYKGVVGPLILAVNQFGKVVDQRVEVQALLGDEVISFSLNSKETSFSRKLNGFWLGPSGPRNRHVSAVLLLRRMTAYSMPTTETQLYLNPWAEKPLKSFLEALPTASDGGGELKFRVGNRLGDMLGLSASWLV
jgi:hypothetical protein